MKYILTAIIGLMGALSYAQDKGLKVSRPDSHAPIGVMGDHMHGKGEVMFSYRFLKMNMTDNLIGMDEVSAETIVTTIANRFSSMEGMPPTLRVVPTNMAMNIHMFGVMYAPSDWMTLMAMGMLVQKDMDHVTYQGGMGTNQLGVFNTSASGIGDTKVSALIKLIKSDARSLHLNIGLSLPTGSITETDDILTPMNMRPTVRMPYPMQLGSGSLDFLPGITYFTKTDKTSWGGQLSGTMRMANNSEGYTLGNQVNATGWASYLFSSWLSGSVRANYSSIGDINGMDANIMLPVQTANPAFQGGKRLDILPGINIIGQSGFVKNQRISIEYGLPIYQDLNGPQMKTSSTLTIGWQYAI